ncbi:MAG TPA: sulfotransferase [Thermomicrobiales bacterium]|nr:sulfotransferase [Thermomicrobiales bacterium]
MEPPSVGAVEPARQVALVTAGDRADWPIVVGGCFRSGTTLVRRLLNAHPRIFCGPETSFFADWYHDYVEGDDIRWARFLEAIRHVAPPEDGLEVLLGAVVELQRRAAARAGKARWASKEPHNVLHLDDWDRLLGDRWLFVHVVRNPLDTLAALDEAELRGSVPSEWSGRIALWRRYLEAGLVGETDRPGRAFRLVYEDLVADPVTTVSRLMAFFGESFDPRQLRYNQAATAGGVEDWKVNWSDEIHSTSVGRWRRDLAPKVAASAWSACGDLWREIDPCLDRLAGPPPEADPVEKPVS